MHHPNTRIHTRSLELVTLCAQATAELPAGHSFLADQMRGASASVVLNFAEGNGKASPRDRRRFFRIAKGSVLETAAAFDVAYHLSAIKAETNVIGQDLCDHIAAMLHRYR